MTKPRVILARNIKEGDFYMEGLVNGEPFGKTFTVDKVRKSTFRDTLSIHKNDADVIGTTLDNDSYVIVERN